MTNIPLTTEGRVYARQVLREIKRLEEDYATRLAGKPTKTWEAAIFPIFERIMRDHSPFSVNAFKAAFKRLAEVPRGERGFILFDGPVVTTLKYSEEHTLTAMTGEREEAVIAQNHNFPGKYVGMVISNISDHALGRFRERSKTSPTIRDGITLCQACSQVGNFVASTRHLVHSDVSLYMPGHDVVAVGNVKISRQGNTGLSSAWFDCRTILPLEACDDQRKRQAWDVLEMIMDPEGRKPEDVEFIPMRDDYVMTVLDAEKKPRH